MEGLRNHNFIIPRPKKKNKGNMDENDGNRLLCSTADFLPGACRTEVGFEGKSFAPFFPGPGKHFTFHTFQ